MEKETRMRRWLIGLAGLLAAACGDDVKVGGPRAQDLSGGDSGSSEGGDASATVDSRAPDSGMTLPADAGAPFFHFLEPTAAHLQRQAAETGRFRAFTAPAVVSSDGSVVMGVSTLQEARMDGLIFGTEAFRWTKGTGTVGLGSLPSCERTDEYLPSVSASVMTSDGSTILGWCDGMSGGDFMFRWTQASGMIAVPSPPGLPSDRWTGITDDGSVAIGYATPADGDDTHVAQAFRWTQATGAVGLGTLPGAHGSDTYGGMTSDAKTFVGQSGDDIFRWTEATGMVALPRPSGFDNCLPAIRQVSADGNVVAGTCTGPGGARFFQWKGTSAPVMVPLPSDAKAELETGLTPDGTMIFGAFTLNETMRAFRWTEATGVEEFGLSGYKECRIEPGVSPTGRVVSADRTVLAGNCVTLFDDSTSLRGAFRWTKESGAVALRPLPGDDGASVNSMSADGSIISGQSSSPGPDPFVPNRVAVVWDANGKPTAVGSLFTSLGFDLEGFTPWYATISPTDRHVIWGAAINAAGAFRGWIARLP
jgi:uncharacterized membrane protein